jgi:squalene-hopene/tetraprenyl-beta-curcumene cyclase
MIFPDRDRLDRAHRTVRDALLAERTPEGHWIGELSTSALSTAVAASALALVQRSTTVHGAFDALIRGGLDWLSAHQNIDGGWGDTVRSFSNISTTMLCRAAYHLTGLAERHPEPLLRCEKWLAERHGRTPAELAEAVRRRYGKDRTFSVPILMTSALAGLVEWKEVPSLPFELACFPQGLFRFLRLPVVSYALPALIAIGQAVYHHRPPWNPLTRLIRWMARSKSLRVLQSIQPSNGGFLEAAPLTAFVTLGLASIGRADHPVVGKAVDFLVKSVRPDGSWPIDTNLSTWVTTLSVNALAAADDLAALDRKEELRDWLLRQQYRERHPYTGADPGAWAWTPLPGGVPDADDTPGAILALCHLGAASLGSSDRRREVYAGVDWLLRLQNADGGMPTFCRGWGALPFDRSGTDLTAHALRTFRALAATTDHPAEAFPRLFGRAVRSGLAYLSRTQRPDGSWLPLWFGNQHAEDVNPTYGTSRVLAAYRDLGMMDSEPARRGVAWLTAAQNADGGWGGDRKTPSSVEETALALDALLGAVASVVGRISNPSSALLREEDGLEIRPTKDGSAGASPSRLQGISRNHTAASGVHTPAASVRDAVNKGLGWLVQQIESGAYREPTPIGFYFARLWYFERLYPIIFSVAALGRARRVLSAAPD